jgi:hypothetical protein
MKVWRVMVNRAWISAKAEPVNERRIQEAKTAAWITEDCHTWGGWKYT